MEKEEERDERLCWISQMKRARRAVKTAKKILLFKLQPLVCLGWRPGKEKPRTAQEVLPCNVSNDYNLTQNRHAVNIYLT